MRTLFSEAAAADPTTTSAEVGDNDVVVVLQVVLFPLFSINAHVHRSFCHFGLASYIYCGHCPLTVSDATCHGSSSRACSFMGETCCSNESTMTNFRIPVLPSSSQANICACRPFLSSMVEFFLVTMYVEFASDGDMRSFLLEVYGSMVDVKPRFQGMIRSYMVECTCKFSRYVCIIY